MTRLRLWLSRVRRATRLFEMTVDDFRVHRVQARQFAQALPGVETDTSMRGFLNAIATIPSQIRVLERKPDEIRARLAAAEPFLRVARRGAPASFEWSGAATLVFSDRELAGSFHVMCDGTSVHGTHAYIWWPLADTEVSEIRQPTPGRLRDSSRYADVSVPDAALFVEHISGTFDVPSPTEARTFFYCSPSGHRC